jgi:hypothetical protein
LFAVQTHDLVTFLGIPALLFATAAAALYAPARRAASTDPLASLKAE